MRLTNTTMLMPLLLASCGSQPAQTGNAPAASEQDPVANVAVANTDDPSPPQDQDRQPNGSTPPATNISECLKQDGERIAEMGLHAIGTEPFWAADVKGRCVTYSHPENQQGTRVWTQFSGTAEDGTWTGALNGQKFVMRTSPKPGCSDGMSDKRYPVAVSLTVNGEERSGCAEPR